MRASESQRVVGVDILKNQLFELELLLKGAISANKAFLQDFVDCRGSCNSGEVPIHTEVVYTPFPRCCMCDYRGAHMSSSPDLVDHHGSCNGRKVTIPGNKIAH